MRTDRGAEEASVARRAGLDAAAGTWTRRNISTWPEMATKREVRRMARRQWRIKSEN